MSHTEQDIPSDHTREFLHGLLDHYEPGPSPRRGYMKGSFVPQIEDVQQQVLSRWRETFGMPVPAYFADDSFALTTDQSSMRYRLISQISGRLPEFYDQAVSIAASMKRNIYNDALKMETVRPRLTLDVPLVPVNPVVPGKLDEWPSNRLAAKQDCAALTFAMTASGIAIERFRDVSFDFGTAAAHIASHPKTTFADRYDLSWLLGMLTTDYAAEVLGAKVNTVTAIGADFGEIERKVMRPLRAKDPSIGFMLSTLVTSNHSLATNHAVAITGALEDEVTVLDSVLPLNGERSLEPEAFWNRWTPVNMQSVVTVIKPL